MDEDRLAVRQELTDLHEYLVECYELADSLVERPGLGSGISKALAGLQYSVAKAAQDAFRLLDDGSLWESNTSAS